MYAGGGYDNYIWSTGDSSESITLSGESLGIGEYEITCLVSTGACNYEDTVSVIIKDVSAVFEKSNLAVKVFPNPTKDNIEIDVGILNYINLKLYNLKGNLLHEQTLESGKNQIALDMLSKGCYFVHLQYEDRMAVSKLIKY